MLTHSLPCHAKPPLKDDWSLFSLWSPHCEWQQMFWHWLTILVENFLFHENLGEVFSNPRKNIKWHANSKKQTNKKAKNRIGNQKQLDWVLKPGKTTGYAVFLMPEIKFAKHPRKWRRSVVFTVAHEVVDVWTRIWADRSEITVVFFLNSCWSEWIIKTNC